MDASDFVRLLSFLVLFFVQCFAEIIRIGGILSDEVEESAFRLAIDFVNNERLLGVNHTLQYITNITGALSSFSVMQIACQQAAFGVMTMVGPMSSTATRSIAPLSKAMQIPQISPISTNPLFDDVSRYPYLIRMLPPDTKQSLALIDLVEAFRWKKLTILTSNTDYGINGLLKFQSTAARRNWQILSVQQFETTDDLEKIDAYRQLRVIKATGVRVVVLNCLFVFGIRVLKQAYEEGMIGPGWAWLVTDGITGTAQELPSYMTGLVGTRPTTHNGQLWPRLEEIWQTANQTEFPGTGGELAAFSANVMDAVFTFAYAMRNTLENDSITDQLSVSLNCLEGSWTHGPQLLKNLREVVGYGTANNIRFNAQGSPMFPAYDIVNLRAGGWLKVGHWDPKNHLNEGFDARKVIFPGNQTMVNDYVSLLANSTLKAVMLNEPPFTRFLTKDFNPRDIKRGEVEGLCIDLFDRLAELIGFNYTIYEVPDQLYGKKNLDTFQWNGLIKELVTKEADITIAPLTINNPRETDIDFTKPYLDLGMRFILKIPEVEPERAFRFLDPFQGDVWMMTILMTVVVGLYVSLLNKLSPYDHHGEFLYKEHAKVEEVCYKKYRQIKRIKIQAMTTLNFSNSVWFSIAALLQQGGEAYPKSTSARIALLTWLFAIVILVATYTANLAAFLTTVRSKTSIDSIEELAAQTKIKYGTVRGSAPYQFFEDSEITTFKDMLLYMKQQDTLVNITGEGVKMTRGGHYAFIWDSAVLDYLVEEKPCNTIKNVGRLFGKIGYGFGLQKNSPYRDELSYFILKLREEGYMDKLVYKWYVENGECTKEVESTEQEKAIEAAGGKLGIDQMLGVFIIVFVGIILSISILLLEWVIAVQSNVDKKDPFRPNSFGESLNRRLKSVKKDFWEERYGCCPDEEVNKSRNNINLPRTARSPSVPPVYRVTEEDVIQGLAGSIARRQRRNLPLPYQMSRSPQPADVQMNGHAQGVRLGVSGGSPCNNAFDMDELDIDNFVLEKRPSYPSLHFDQCKAFQEDNL